MGNDIITKKNNARIYTRRVFSDLRYLFLVYDTLSSNLNKELKLSMLYTGALKTWTRKSFQMEMKDSDLEINACFYCLNKLKIIEK